MGGFRIFCIGEGLVLRAVAERCRALAHDVVGLYDARASDAPVAASIAAQPCDLLLSVANRHVLSPETLRWATVAAVNYHNGPLPRYAGLRAPAWAIANREPTHGIVWHRMEPGIDTGAILARRALPLSSDETTATLNARCTQAAIDSLDELLARLSRGDAAGEAQAGARGYFNRRAIAPDAGVIDWTRPAAMIAARIRACDWGPMANDFGSAMIRRARGGPLFVRRAVASSLRGDPGEVLASARDRTTVACGDGAVELWLDADAALRVGERLPPIDPTDHDAYRDALLAEAAWLPALRRIAPSVDPLGVAPATGAITAAGDASLFLRAVARTLGRDAVAAIAAEAPSPLLHAWRPTFAGAPADASPPPPRDIHRRHPGLSHLADWPAMAAALVCDGPTAPPLAANAVAFAGGRIHFCAARVHAVAIAAMMARIAAAPPPAPSRRPILAEIARWRVADPDAPAIEHNGDVTTRGQLGAAADAMAARLLAAGLRVEDGVGIALEASADFVAAGLGAMRAGGAYVPLAIDAPPARRAVEIAEAGITHIVCRAVQANRFAGLPVRVLTIDALAGSVPLDIPPPRGEQCAYRIFTSGSTGRPKAVEVTHAALANLVLQMRTMLPFGVNDRMTMLAAPVFDASVADIWPILTAGGTVLVPPPRLLRDPLATRDWLVAARATCAFVPTAIAERLLDLPWPAGTTLRTLLTGGDALHRRPPPGLPFRLINTYGPTENTVDALWAEIGPGEGAPPIGLPVLGVTAEILEPDGRPVAPGEAGELVLGGAQVARGYRGRAALTRERFEADTARPDGRRYRTGDRCRQRSDGQFEFLGRLDDQLQLHGIRVEPGEIEAVLKRDPRVAEAACLPESRDGMVAGLVALVVPVGIVSASLTEDLRARLRAELPPAIVPRAIELRDALPYTPQGKLDRRALGSRPVAARGSLADGDPLRALWPAGADEEASFWDLGGDSLAAMAMLAEVEAATGAHVPVGAFLADPTLRGLRAAVAARAGSVVVELRPGHDPPLVCWHGYTGDLEAFRHFVALPGDRRVVGLVSPALEDASRAPACIEAAAAAGLEALRAAGIATTAAMIGYSWGGLLAFEAARQCAVDGVPSGPVWLIGTLPPRRAVTPLRVAAAITRNLPRLGLRIVRGQQRLPRWVRRRGRPDALSALSRHHMGLWRDYDPAPTAMPPVTLFRETDGADHLDPTGRRRHELPDYGWSDRVGAPVAVRWLACDHLGLMRLPAVGRIATTIEAAATEARAGPTAMPAVEGPSTEVAAPAFEPAE